MKKTIIIVIAFLVTIKVAAQLHLPHPALDARDLRIDPKEKFNGHIKRITEYDIRMEDGVVPYKDHRKARRLPLFKVFSKSGRLEQESYKSGEDSYLYHFKYDSLDRPTEIYDIRPVPKQPVRRIQYNEKKNEIIVSNYYKGKPDEKVVFLFDDKGSLAQRSSYDANDKITMEIVYAHDNSGRITVQVSRNFSARELPTDSRLPGYRTKSWKNDTVWYAYKIVNDTNIVTATRRTDTGKNYLFMMNANVDSAFRSMTIYTDRESLEIYYQQTLIRERDSIRFYTSSSLGKDTIIYDLNNNMKSFVWRGKQHFNVVYKKDKLGNWIERKEIFVDDKKVKNITEREIEYY